MTPTFAEIVRSRAQREPDELLFTWLADGEREAGTRTLGELDRRACAIAASMADRAGPGERAVLLYGDGLSFVDAFLGCLYAGVIPVPAAADYVRPEAAVTRLLPIVRDCEPRILLTDAGELPDGLLRATADSLTGIPILDTALVPSTAAVAPPASRAGADDVAFVQYTSGSTAEPKGVMVTHTNLVTNLDMSRQHMRMTQESTVVGWVPMFHDLGLIGMVLSVLYQGGHSVLMSPTAFLQNPRRWLAAITSYQATIAGGPNFAYDLCAARIPAPARAGLDLSGWRRAFVGGEPVRPGTLERFAQAFRGCGFQATAFDPVYGMAEATVFAAGALPSGPSTLEVAAGPLQQDVVEPVTPGTADSRRLVSAGTAAPGVTLAIVDPGTRAAVPESRVGEIWISGPNIAKGYWRRPDQTRATFDQPLDGDRFLRSGDLGFLHEGQLYVTGRIKDLIIVRGRNHHPHDIELTAQASHPGLRPGGGAAFSIEGDDEERVIVVHEIRPAHVASREEMLMAVRRAVAQEHGLKVHDLVCLPPGRLRKTTSGKTMRHAMRQEYLAGALAFDVVPG